MPSLATHLHQALVSSGIPVSGVSGEGMGCRIDFAPEATQAQRVAGELVKNSFDWTARIVRPFLAIMIDIAGLSTTDRTKLLAAISADFLRSHPRFAKIFDIDLYGDAPPS